MKAWNIRYFKVWSQFTSVTLTLITLLTPEVLILWLHWTVFPSLKHLCKALCLYPHWFLCWEATVSPLQLPKYLIFEVQLKYYLFCEALLDLSVSVPFLQAPKALHTLLFIVITTLVYLLYLPVLLHQLWAPKALTM